MKTLDLALASIRRHLSLNPELEHYTGILTLHAFARLGEVEPSLRAECAALFAPFLEGRRVFRCNFPNYTIGGLGAAYWFWRGLLPRSHEALFRHQAGWMLRVAPRDAEGIWTMPAQPGDRIWIDAAFAAAPYMLYSGLALDEEAAVQEGWFQIERMHARLLDPATGLLHQSRGFCGPNKLSRDHWSRGNGWGLLTLAEMAAYLPDAARREKAAALLADLLTAALRYQDAAGLWHQEMTDHGSYVESSGSALILYALGLALELGLLPDSRDKWLLGLRGLRGLVGEDGSVDKVCVGCLCPGDGSPEAYAAWPHLRDDPHGFGAVALAYGQAHRMGVREL